MANMITISTSYNYINVAEGLNTQKTMCQPSTTALPPHLGGHITFTLSNRKPEIGSYQLLENSFPLLLLRSP